jgi:hypothetical protein
MGYPSMEQRESEEKKVKAQNQLNKIAKLQRQKEIQELDGKLRESRQTLKDLRAENDVENKVTRQKKFKN